MKYTGIVKFFDAERGFGFISCQGQDIFVHAKDIRPKCENPTLIKGQTVTYGHRINSKGVQADDVQVADANGNV